MTQYYITASAPITLTLGGRSISMNPGESKGPFSESEYNMIKSQADPSRYSVVSYEPTAEQSQPLLSEVDSNSPIDPKYLGYTPSETPTHDPNNPKDIFREEVNLNPENYKSDSGVKVEEKTIVIQPLEVPEKETTSKAEVLSSTDDLDVTEPIVVPKEEPIPTTSTTKRKRTTTRRKASAPKASAPKDTETSDI